MDKYETKKLCKLQNQHISLYCAEREAKIDHIQKSQQAVAAKQIQKINKQEEGQRT